MPRRKQICPQRLDADNVKSEEKGGKGHCARTDEPSGAGNNNNNDEDGKEPDDVKEKAKDQSKMKETVLRENSFPNQQLLTSSLESVLRASLLDRCGSDDAMSRNQSACNTHKAESVIKKGKDYRSSKTTKSYAAEGKSAEKCKTKESSDKKPSKSSFLTVNMRDFPTWHKKSKFSNGLHDDQFDCFGYSDFHLSDEQPLDLSRKPKKKKEKPNSECKDVNLKTSASVEMTDISSSLQSLQQKFGGDFPFKSSRRPRIGLTEQYYMSHLHVSPSLFSGWRKPTPRIQLKDTQLQDHSQQKNGLSSEEHTVSNETSAKTETSARNSQTVNAILTKISGVRENEKQDTCTNKHTTHRCSCQKTFPTLYELSIHLQESGHTPGAGKQTNLMEYPKLVRGQDMWLNQGSEQTKQILRCIQCGESFKSLPELTVHMMETQHYTKIVSTEHGRRGTHKCSAYCERESADSECVFKCKICQKVFPDMEALANHMVISGHHRKQSPRSCSSGLGDAGNRSHRKRGLEDSVVSMSKTSTIDNKRTHLMPQFCGDVDHDNYRTKSPSQKSVKMEVSRNDKRIVCENCGDRIDMELFVEHIRYCLRKRVHEIHTLRASKLNSASLEERMLSRGSLRDFSSQKCKRTMSDKGSESLRSGGKLPSKQRKLNSSSCCNSYNGDTKHYHKGHGKPNHKNHKLQNSAVPDVKYTESESQSAPASPCNRLTCKLSPGGALTNSSPVITSSRSPSPFLSSNPQTGINCDTRSPCDRSKSLSLDQTEVSAGKDCSSNHQDKDGYVATVCSASASPLTASNVLLLANSPISDQRCETVSSSGESRSRSQSPISLKGSSSSKAEVSGFACDSSRSPSPHENGTDSEAGVSKQQVGDTDQAVKHEIEVKSEVKAEKPHSENSTKILFNSVENGSKINSLEERSPSAIEQMILEYSSKSVPDSESHLKKLRNMKLPTCDTPGRSIQKSLSCHKHAEADSDQKNGDSPLPPKHLDIIDPDSSETSSPATSALKAMENLIQKSFESKNVKSPNKLCPIDMLRQPLYGWFYQRDMYNKTYPATQVLKKDTGLIGTSVMQQSELGKRLSESGTLAGSQTNGFNNNNKGSSTEHKSPESKSSQKKEDISEKKESVVCKYLNFFDDSPTENGKTKSSALDSLSSFVYGQPLTSEHPLDSLQRLISKAETPHEKFSSHCKNTLSTPEPARDSSSPDMEEVPLNLTVKCHAIKNEQNCLSEPPHTDADQKSDDSRSGTSDGESVEYKCPACNRHFATKGSYRYHLSRCHLSTVKKYGISTAFHMSPYIYLPLDHTAKFTKYYEMAQELAGKELTNDDEEK